MEDFDNVVESLFDMLAYLLINYFEKYEFGTRNDVLCSFLLLPSIIRYKVLYFLYKKYPDNILVIDKLFLTIMKAFSVGEATEWLEREKDVSIQKETVSKKAFSEITEKEGKELVELVQTFAPINMYVLCKKKHLQVREVINDRDVLYSDFESALPYYISYGILTADDREIIEFNDIMNFCI